MKREMKMLPKPRPIDVTPKYRRNKSQHDLEPLDAPRAAKNAPQENIAQAEPSSGEADPTNPPPAPDTAAS